MLRLMTVPPHHESPQIAMLTSNPSPNQTSPSNHLTDVSLVVDIRNYSNWSQLAYCKKEKNCGLKISVLEVVGRGASLGLVECQHQFRQRRWNCIVEEQGKDKNLLTGTREKAFLQSVSSAAVAYLMTRCQEILILGAKEDNFISDPVLLAASQGVVVTWTFTRGDLNFLFHISSSWAEISLYTEFQLPRLSGSRIASFRLNPICFISFFCVWGG